MGIYTIRIWFAALMAFAMITAESSAQEVTLSAQIQIAPIDTSAMRESHAILVANADYFGSEDIVSLPSANEDVAALEKVLIERVGYLPQNIHKILGRDHKTRFSIRSEIIRLDENLAFDANVLIYYVGHGFTFKGVSGNYIVPTSFDSNNTASTTSGAVKLAVEQLVKLEYIVAELSNKGKRNIVLFYNACRNDALDRSTPFSDDTVLQGAKDDFGKYNPSEDLAGIHAFYAAGRGGRAVARLNVGDESESKLTLFGRTLVESLSKTPSIRFEDLKREINNSTAALISQSNLRADQAPIPHYSFNPTLLQEQTEQGYCLAQAVLENGQTTCTNAQGLPIGVSADPCRNSFQDWATLAKSENTAEAFQVQYAQCKGVVGLSQQWLASMRQSWRDGQSAEDKCAGMQGFLKTYPETSYTAEAEAYLASASCAPATTEMALERLKDRAWKTLAGVQIKPLIVANAKLQTAKEAQAAHRPMASLLQHSLRLQGCSVSGKGSLSQATADGVFGAGSATGLRRYNAAITSISQCKRLKDLKRVGSSERFTTAFLLTTWLPDAMSNVGEISQCMDYVSAPVCGCGSDPAFEAKDGICVEKTCAVGLRLNRSTGNCEKPAPACTGGKRRVNGRCVCDAGQSQNSRGECYTPAPSVTPTAKHCFKVNGRVVCD